MMKIKEIKNDILGDSYFDIDHPSGLKILFMPKPSYSGAYAIFATKYGSIDTSIETGENEFITIPEGTAHFLEHKLFESEDLDAFERFAKTGASANAYTSFDRTGYLFSCTGSFKENLEILLDFVQHPYFTQATVEKEQGIIGQEIDMYRDVADWEVMFNCLRTMYAAHPVRIDIAGTQDSIAQIDAELLYKCYANFYNLNNMVLAVAGNTTVEEILEVADRVLVPVEGKQAVRNIAPDNGKVSAPYTEEALAVTTKQFMLGFKEIHDTPERTLKEEVCMEILLEILIGKSSELYNRLFNSALVNSPLSFEYFNGFGYACALISGESDEPEKVREEINKEILSLREKGVSKVDFERTKKKLYGALIMAFNDVDNIANSLATSYFMNESVFSDFDAYREITIDDINETLKNSLDIDNSTLSVIIPKK